MCRSVSCVLFRYLMFHIMLNILEMHSLYVTKGFI